MYKTVYYVKSLQTKRALLRFIEKIGANLVQNFMKQHKLFATIFNFGDTKHHNIHDFQRYYTI